MKVNGFNGSIDNTRIDPLLKSDQKKSKSAHNLKIEDKSNYRLSRLETQAQHPPPVVYNVDNQADTTRSITSAESSKKFDKIIENLKK